jgi:glycosyltransferase involved in cell wall biosynthesis
MLDTQKAPLISVIMIFLNAEKFIQEAIESVLSQTYTNWELVFVDDGSTDSSKEIVRRYVQKYPHQMRYFQHEGHQNRGMSASRNLGIRQSQGEYIAFLDADDVYLPQKFERQAALLETQPTAAMVYGNTQYWYSWTGEPEDQLRDTMRTLGVRAETIYQPPELVTRFLQNTARTPGTCSVLVRRMAIEKIGRFEERFSGMFEDQVFFYKLCLHESVYVESGYWARYRQHPDSHSQVSRQKGAWDPGHRLSPTRAAFLDWLEAYLMEQNVTEPQIWQTLRKELWSYRHPRLYHLLSTVSHWKGALKMRVRNLL